MFAFSYGLSQFLQNAVFGGLYYGSARLTYHHPQFNGDKVWIALFAMLFGTFASAQANAFGPDFKKAQAAAEKIFKITHTPSEIDVLADPTEQIVVEKKP